jgi:hypothetical protein
MTACLALLSEGVSLGSGNRRYGVKENCRARFLLKLET